MPNNRRRKGKSDRDNRTNGSLQTSDDDSFNDNASVASNYSEVRSTEDGGGGAEDAEDAAAAGRQQEEERFEERLAAAVDGFAQKSAQGRRASYEAVARALVRRYAPQGVVDRRLTVCDAVERSLKRGRADEQAAAARVAALVCVQLGALDDCCEDVCRALRPVLTQIVNDATVASGTRSECCTALSLMAFLAGGEMGDIFHLMQQFENIFSGSYLKSDGTVPNVSVESGFLHSAALSAWTLLCTLMAPGDIYSMMGSCENFAPSIIQLSELLKSPHLEVRMAAGESLAMVFEIGCEFQEDFGDDYKLELIGALHQLATDSHKYRAKKDRKQQRSTFRDVLHYIENGTVPDIQIKFGHECLVLDTWVRRKHYDALCNVLGSGFNLHLAENDLLRDIFQLGSKVLISDISLQRLTKSERHYNNAVAFKARTISRGKNRDKRSDF